MQNIKIPQNVQVADKLVGPFSLKQLILVGMGGGFSYTLYAFLQKSLGYVPVIAHMFIWLPAILSAAFALVRINDLSLFRCCLLIIETLSKPRQRSLLPRQGIIINIQTRSGRKLFQRKEKEKAEEQKTPAEARSKLEELTQLLDAEKRRPSPPRLDTVFGEKEDAEEEAHHRRLNELWEQTKRARTGVTVGALEQNVDSVHSRTPSP